MAREVAARLQVVERPARRATRLHRPHRRRCERPPALGAMTSDAYARVPEWLLDAAVSDRAVRLYALLDRYAGADGAAFPSRRTLAERLRCSRDVIDRAMKDLVAAGAVDVVPRFDPAGDRTTNGYRVAARARLGSRVDAATPVRGRGHGGRADAATGGRVDAAQNESHFEVEPMNESPSSSRSLAPVDGGHRDDDAAARVLDEVWQRLAQGALKRRNSEVARRGDEPIPPGIRSERWLAEAANRERAGFESVARAYLADDPTLTSDGLAAMLAPDLVSGWWEWETA
jgi:hypothetical protein